MWDVIHENLDSKRYSREESVNDGIKRLLRKYPPIDLTIPGNAIPSDWEWDDEEDDIYE